MADGLYGLIFRYNPYVLFWTGVGIDLYFGLAPFDAKNIIAVASSKQRSPPAVGSANPNESAAATLAWTRTTNTELNSMHRMQYCDAEAKKSCRLHASVQPDDQVSRIYLILHIKTVFGTARLIGSVVFWILLKRSPAAVSVASFTPERRVIKMTIVIELEFCIIPGLAALIWSIIVPNVSVSQVLGEHATLALSIDAAITSTVCYKLLLKRKKKANNVISAWPTPQSQQQP